MPSPPAAITPAATLPGLAVATGAPSLLGRCHCELRVRLNQYDHGQANRCVNQAGFPFEGEALLAGFLGSTWAITGQLRRGQEGAETVEGEIVFRCLAGELLQGSVAVDFVFGDWSENNYVLLPAAAYRGNRFVSRRIPYSPKLRLPGDIGPDRPPIISDVPRLACGSGPSRIQERSGSLARPALGFYDERAGQGVWLLTVQGNALGDYGLSVEESPNRERAMFSLVSPVVREEWSYRICDSAFPSPDRPRDFQVGDEVVMRFCLVGFAAARVQTLFDQFAVWRKAMLPFPAPRPALPFSACLALQEEKFNRENFVSEHGYYSVGPRTSFLQDWQIGWTGGMISTYPLLFAGGVATRQNVLRNFDWLFPNGISPSGFFWDSGRNGTEWIGGDIRNPHTANWHLIRKSGDGVFYLLKQFLLMEKMGIAIKPAWREGTRRVCDALCALWRKHGQFGQFVDSITGEIRVGGSTCGAIIPAGLTLAAAHYSQGEYLDVACEAAEMFYDRFTCQGLSCGGPGDALQNPDSESWYALVESYSRLYDRTGDRRWLERAAEAARQFATWVVAYDFRFPPGSTFARAGIRSTGAVYANTQNKHAAPGICTYSGLALLKLFRATGDRFHLELLRDIAFHLPQYLPHPLKPLGDAAFGRVCERVNLTDWEGAERIGETLRMSTWAETALMLTAVEIPGIYIQPDVPLLGVFDNVEAEVVTNTPSEIVVALKNPTPAPAEVTVAVETSADAKATWPENALLGTRTERLNPGESRVIHIDKCLTRPGPPLPARVPLPPGDARPASPSPR